MLVTASALPPAGTPYPAIRVRSREYYALHLDKLEAELEENASKLEGVLDSYLKDGRLVVVISRELCRQQSRNSQVFRQKPV